jgi:hypothetical protein
MKMQHVNVKLLLGSPEAIRLEPLVPIFHEWIEHKAMEELLLDIADYTHVPEGPGVVLIGHQADYSVDNTLGRLGVRYNRKIETEGDNQESMSQAARAALTACQRLEDDPRLNGKLRFGGQEVDLFINDRLLAPNTEESRQEARAEFETFFKKLFDESDFSLAFDTDPRRLFRVTARSAQSFSSTDLLKNLA